MNAITKYPKRFDVDAQILVYWLMYARTPKKAEPDADGMYDLSEIGEVRMPDQKVLRDTPYSICEGRR
jgi:hypothetical protein